jgi:hypothetical protein
MTVFHVRDFRTVEVYWLTRRFASAALAKDVWERIERKLGNRAMDLGIYRHGSSKRPGHLITVVSLKPEGVIKAERLMRPGVDVDPLDDGDFSFRELDALIARRADRVMHAPPGATSERYHYGGDGRRLNPDGSMG